MVGGSVFNGKPLFLMKMLSPAHSLRYGATLANSRHILGGGGLQAFFLNKTGLGLDGLRWASPTLATVILIKKGVPKFPRPNTWRELAKVAPYLRSWGPAGFFSKIKQASGGLGASFLMESRCF